LSLDLKLKNMEFANLTKEEIKNKYLHRHGFVFRASAPCRDDNCSLITHSLISKKIATEQPEFVVKINAQTFVFIYREELSIDMPNFLAVCDHLSMITGAFKINSLKEWVES